MCRRKAFHYGSSRLPCLSSPLPDRTLGSCHTLLSLWIFKYLNSDHSLPRASALAQSSDILIQLRPRMSRTRPSDIHWLRAADSLCRGSLRAPLGAFAPPSMGFPTAVLPGRWSLEVLSPRISLLWSDIHPEVSPDQTRRAALSPTRPIPGPWEEVKSSG